VRKLVPLLFAVAVLALEPFAEQAMRELSRGRPALPCTCIGPRQARLDIVYLHGRDTYAPSWQEIRNRQTLRAISEVLQARIALPRTRSGWPQKAQIAGSVEQIRAAAAVCFDEPHFVVLGFSDGANAVNQLFVQCRTDVASAFVSAGSSEGIASRGIAGLNRCGQLRLIAGRHEPGFATTSMFARQLARQGGDVRFYEHPGPHELPFVETLTAIREDAPVSREPANLTIWTLTLFLATGLAAAGAIRRYGFRTFRAGAAVLVIACALTLATGNSPGLFLSSLPKATFFVVAVAVLAAGISGPWRGMASRASIVLFCGAAGCAWQVAGAPWLATLLV
jgi:hypothetical protein